MNFSRKPVALVVDDEEACRKLVGLFLAGKGFKVLLAECGETAVKICSRIRGIDIVISDIEMPGISGLEAADRISKLRPGAPILFLSGGSVDDAELARRLGPARAYLRKPFLLATLASTVSGLRGARTQTA